MLLLGTGLFLLLVLLFYSPSSPVYVHSSGGGSVRHGNGVLMPPDEVSSGQRIRVVSSTLEMSTGSGSLRMRFRPGSRFRVERVYRDSRGVRLAHQTDTGSSYTAGPPVYHRWGEAVLVQVEGRLSWSSRDGTWSCFKGPDFSGYWLREGGATPGPGAPDMLGEGKTSPPCQSTGREGPIPLRSRPPDYQRHVGALMPSRRLLDELVRSWKRRGRPRTLRDALGYWAFDRWGGLYLFEPGQKEVRLTSAGPDGVFYTEDDRRWERPVGERQKPQDGQTDS